MTYAPSAMPIFVLLTVLSALFFVSTAVCCWTTWRVAAKTRFLSSLQDAILAAERDASLALLTVRRVEGRQTGSIRHSVAKAARVVAVESMDKAELRAYAGLVPGKPVGVRTYDGNNNSNQRVQRRSSADTSGAQPPERGDGQIDIEDAIDQA